MAMMKKLSILEREWGVQQIVPPKPQFNKEVPPKEFIF